MKIFSGGEKFTEHNTKIKQLLGEGTGGRKLVSSSSQNLHWREIAKQTIKDLAGSQKDSGRNYAYLAKFKESLDQRQVKNPISTGANLFNQNRSKSEDPRNVSSSADVSNGRATPKLDITSKHLYFEQRRFSDSRPQSASRAQISDRPSHFNPIEGFSLKQSKVQDVLGCLQKSRTMNYGSFQDQIRVDRSSFTRNQNSSKHIKTEVEKSTGKFDNLCATPASNKRPRTAKDRLLSSLESKSFSKEKSDLMLKNYLTPKPKLVFNKKVPETDRFSKSSYISS